MHKQRQPTPTRNFLIVDAVAARAHALHFDLLLAALLPLLIEDELLVCEHVHCTCLVLALLDHSLYLATIES